jgi:hypothetical protein
LIIKINANLNFAQNNACNVFWPENITCASIKILNLKEEFAEISTKLKSEEKIFKKFYLNAPTNEIPENVFIDIKFKIINLNSNFTRIHSNAFLSTSNYTKKYHDFSGSNSRLFNDPPEFDLYKALSSLIKVRLIIICLGYNISHDIPDYAFQIIDGPQNSLSDIYFAGEFEISRIGNYAFYNIPNLESIIIENVTIHYITAHAFDLPYSQTNEFMFIHLVSAKLNENSLETGIFRSDTHILNLKLGSIKFSVEVIFI